MVSSEQVPQFNLALFEQDQATTNEQGITELSATQIEHFLSYFDDLAHQNTPPHERVANYLSIILDRFSYSERSLPARKALESNSGNCLSLALITAALAELAEVTIDFQTLTQYPVFSISGDLVFTSDHIRSVLRGDLIRNNRDQFAVQRQIRIDYFPTDGLRYADTVSSTQMKSLYYSNVATEFLDGGQLDEAFNYARVALKIDSDNVSALNTVGILHRRRGDIETAEKIYRWGARKTDNRALFLRNLLVVLESEGQTDEALLVKQEIKSIQSTSPWQWVRNAREASSNKDFEVAALAYQRALEIAPDVHQLHADTAIVNYKLGRVWAAKKHFRQAIELANDAASRSLYKEKLTALNR